MGDSHEDRKVKKVSRSVLVWRLEPTLGAFDESQIVDQDSNSGFRCLPAGAELSGELLQALGMRGIGGEVRRVKNERSRSLM